MLVESFIFLTLQVSVYCLLNNCPILGSTVNFKKGLDIMTKIVNIQQHHQKWPYIKYTKEI